MTRSELWKDFYEPKSGPYYSYGRQDPPKIALVGTCSVGKTTIMDHFSRHPFFPTDPNEGFIGHVNEVAEQYFANGLTLEEHMKLKDAEPSWVKELPRTWWRVQYEIMGNIMAAERGSRHQYSSVLLCDRALLCPIVYTWAHGDPAHARHMMKNVYYWFPSYFEIALLDPVGVPYVQTAVRSETPDQRLHIHDTYLKVCEYFGIPYTLVRGILKQRIDQVQMMLTNAHEATKENRL